MFREDLNSHHHASAR